MTEPTYYNVVYFEGRGDEVKLQYTLNHSYIGCDKNYADALSVVVQGESCLGGNVKHPTDVPASRAPQVPEGP